MKVILAGYPKTGTKTMRQAFIELGYSNYDFPENCQFLRKEWMKILTVGGTTEDFRRMFENVDTITDMPGCYFWEEIHEAFPDAKIILTKRANEEEWCRSFKRQMATGDAIIHKILPWLSPTNFLFSVFLKKLAFCVFGTYGTDPIIGKNKFSDVILKGKYRRHNAHVLQCAPPDKLLVYDLDEGWEPLCEFLGCAIPEKPFPHKNRGASITEEWMENHPYFLQMQKEMMISCGTLLSAFVLFCLYRILFRRSPPPPQKSLISHISPQQAVKAASYLLSYIY